MAVITVIIATIIFVVNVRAIVILIFLSLQSGKIVATSQSVV